MKKLVLPAAAMLLVAGSILAGRPSKNDPVIMTVNGKDVPLSEFEYLYNKNNTQQIERQTPREYLDMFVNYKLKVADAEAHGLDTTQSFLQELASHRAELAKPYMLDSTVQEQLIREIYDHTDRVVDVSHVMVPRGTTKAEKDSLHALLDSIRTLIVSGKESLGVAAVKFSIDPRARVDSGHMGWMRANVYPYAFENVAFATPKGEVSEIVETPFGLHIIKVHDVKPDPGKVSVSHIMKMTRGLSPEQKAERKAQIDSIYQLVKGGDAALFAEIAGKESEDRGSAANGGQLPWFGVREMVPEFEATSFALKDGEVSAPFETTFGYHIVLRHAHKGRPSYEDEREAILRMISRDDRGTRAEEAQMANWMKEYKASVNEKGIKAVEKTVAKFGAPDSLALAAVRALTKTEVARIGKTKIMASEVAEDMRPSTSTSVEEWMAAFRHAANTRLQGAVREAAIANLPAKYPAYGNLLNEYRDGILLFDISNRNVWDKAAQDSVGLARYFEEHRASYTWEKPHFKGVIVFASDDSVATKVRHWLDINSFSADALPKMVKNAFGRSAKAEKVLVAKGENPVVDAVAFDGPVPDLSRSRWKAYFVVEGKVIDQPEDAQDMRGSVSADYQNELEKAWVKELRDKYPVKINEPVLLLVK